MPPPTPEEKADRAQTEFESQVATGIGFGAGLIVAAVIIAVEIGLVMSKVVDLEVLKLPIEAYIVPCIVLTLCSGVGVGFVVSAIASLLIKRQRDPFRMKL